MTREVHLPVVPEQASSLSRDGRRNFVYPADVTGRFATFRKVLFFVLIGIYVSLPFVPIGGHPAIFLDIEHRAFYLFGLVFNSRDIWMMVFVVTGAMFALVSATAAFGRVFCGYACPQTVYLDGVFRRIERLVEGSRAVRMRRDEGPRTWGGTARKIVKHVLFVLTSFALAHVFLAYFVSIPGLFDAMRHHPSQHPEAFAIVSVATAILYGNFAWFREQFCVVLCPYGRLQSVLFDPDTLVVGYDEGRGEPRAKGKDREGKGDCVDCGRCVVVCPTGIDIRNGLQMDCIACSACIDACDEVMDKLERPRGLIRYDSQNGLQRKPRRFLRPRMYAYAVLGVLGLVAARTAFMGRTPFDAELLRAVGPAYSLEGDTITDSFRIRLVNKRSDRTTFAVEPEPAPGATFVVPLRQVTLEPLAAIDLPVFVSVPKAEYKGEFTVAVLLRAEASGGESKRATSRFLGPGRP